MQCNNCGSPLNGNETMCPVCGAQLMVNYGQGVPMGNGIEQPMGQVAPQPVQNMGMGQATPYQGQAPQYNQNMPYQEQAMPQYNQPMDYNGQQMPEAPVQNVGMPQSPAQIPEQPLPNQYQAQQPVEMMPQQGMPQQVIPEQPYPQMGAMPSMPLPPTNDASLAANTEEKNDKNKLLYILIIAIIAIGLIIGGITIASSISGNKSNQTPTPSPTPSEEPVPVDTTASYGGYSFNIPDGYTTTEDENYGLIFNNGEIAYSIKVDYTNNFDAYKKSFTQNYPTQASSLELSYETTPYLILQMANESTQTKALHYVMSPNTSTTFVGAIVRKDKKPGEMKDLKVLTDLLTTATLTNDNPIAGNDLDNGKDGIISIPTTYTPFIFPEDTNTETNTNTNTDAQTQTTTQ